MMKRSLVFLSMLAYFWSASLGAQAQCTSADIMEPGFKFITSSRGCAPFTIEVQTLFLNSTPGTVYHVDWGDGSSVEDYIQVNNYPNGPIITHEYVNAPVECGYQVIVEVENACNPINSVVLEPINVIVWTEDIVLSDPDVYRVCHGFASSIQFSDISTWNCFPRADARENADPRWIQWIYGHGANGNRISNVRIDGIIPGAFPYYDPVNGTKPIYPVTNIDEVSLNVQVPVTTPADIGKDFFITLNNWNTCNQYDENLADGTLNPITPGGDNPPRVSESRIVIVDTPTPDFVARKDNNSNPIRWEYCIGEIIYFDNESTGPGGSSLAHTWEFYDGPNVTDALLETKTDSDPIFSYAVGGQKLIRLIVGDNNALGGCSAVVEKVVTITPTTIAQISASNTKFCKNPGTGESFSVSFNDVSIGSTVNAEWKWEFYDENDQIIRAEPNVGYSTSAPVPYTLTYTNPGVHRVVLIYRDITTLCDIRDEINIVVYNNPEPSFVSEKVCDGLSTELVDQTSIQSIKDSQVIRWEWDFDYDQVTFNPDSVFDNVGPDTLKRQFNYGFHQVALQATNDQNGCSAIFTDAIEVYQNPKSAFSMDSLQGCSPLSVTFENTVATTQAVNIDQYIWSIDYGNGFIDTLYADPASADFSPDMNTTFENHSNSSTTFNIILKAVSDDGCSFNSLPDSVSVLPSVKPGFYSDYDPFAKNCSPVEVNFQIDDFTMSLTPDEYIWTVTKDNELIRRENVNSSVSQFAHTFISNSRGINSYLINLRVEATDICVEDSTLFVNINPIPESEFSIDTLEFTCDVMVLEIHAIEKGLLEYNWTINKGGMIYRSNDNKDNFIYEVLRPVTGAPNLNVDFELQTANYAFCESGVSSQSITIPAIPQLEASFYADPEMQIYPNATVELNNTSIRSNATHLWDFGDGRTSSVENPLPHAYEKPGDYIIKLNLSENNCESMDSVTIHIQPTEPIADFIFDPSEGCVPLTVNFTNLTKYGDSESYKWNFGQGEGISFEEHPTHTYYKAGVYSVKLEASNESGMTNSIVKQSIIEVFPAPYSDFQIRPEQVKLPEDPIYTTNLSYGADSYLWDFGDGSSSTEFEPSHIYLDTGRYDITLIANTSKGCMDTVIYENAVEVIEGNEIRIPNAFTPSLDGPSGGSRYSSGRNDVFYPVTEGVVAYKLQIYNRWGELLFDTEDKSIGWDGYYKGKVCAPDVYIYKINFKFIDGREVSKFGDIMLIR